MIKSLIEVSLTTSVIIAVLLVSIPLVSKRYSPKCRYWIWFFIAVRLIIPVNFSIAKAPVTIPALIQPINNTPIKITSNQGIVITSTGGITTKVEHSGLISNNLLVLVWLIGIVLFLFWHISSHLIFCKGLKRFGKSADEQILKILNEIKNKFNIKRNIRILICKRLSSPMMLGFFKPCLIIPDKEFDCQELDVIISHELVHFKRHDLWYKLVILLARSVHWFNPLVHIMSAAANRDIEISCDEEVIKDSCADFRKRYAETVLKVIRTSFKPKTTLSTYFYGGKNSMKERFSSMFDLKAKKKGLALIIFVLIATLIAGMLISCENSTEQKEAPTTVKTRSIKDLPSSTTNSKTASSPVIQESSQKKTDSGSYMGFGDSNSIAIRMSGVQDEKNNRVFEISEDVKKQIEKLGLKKDDQVKFTYYEQEAGQPVISSIEKLSNTTGQVKGKRYDGEMRLASTSDWFGFEDLTPAEKIMYSITLPEAWTNDNTVFSLNGVKVAEVAPVVKLKDGQKLPEKFISSTDIYGETIKTSEIKVGDMNGKLRVYKQIPDDNPKPWYAYTYFLQRGDKVFVMTFYTFNNSSTDAALYEKILSTLYFK